MRSGKQRMSDHQKGLLVQYMQRHPYFAKTGLCPGTQDRQVAKKMWDKVTNLLNSGGPAQKSSSGWKQTWADMKSRVKLKAGEIQQQQRAGSVAVVGGSSAQVSQLNETEVAIYGLLGGTEWIGASENGMGVAHFVNVTEAVQSPTSSTEMLDDEATIHLPAFVSKLETIPTRIKLESSYHGQPVSSRNQMPYCNVPAITFEEAERESEEPTLRPPSAPARLMELSKNGSLNRTTFQIPPSTSSTSVPTFTSFVSSSPKYIRLQTDNDQKSDNDLNDDSDLPKTSGKKKRKMTSVYQETTELYAAECREMRHATMLGIEALKSLKESIEMQTSAMKEMTTAILGLSAAVASGAMTNASVNVS